MKKTCLLLVIVLTLTLVAPAFAREKEPIGFRIYLNDFNNHAQTILADQPFYISHGWLDITPYSTPGQVTLALEVDGGFVKPTYIERSIEIGDNYPLFDKMYYFNFPEGMTGEHLFELHWIGVCWVAEYYGLVDECANPYEDFDWYYNWVVITFE